MTKSVSIIVAGTMLVAAVGSAAAANRKAQEMVSGLAKEQDELLAQFPALAPIDSEIRMDCAAKNRGKVAIGDFCGCASAVTMGLWRSGVDPNMVPRINAFLKSPTDAGTKDFLRYQGPELYRGICNEAGLR